MLLATFRCDLIVFVRYRSQLESVDLTPCKTLLNIAAKYPLFSPHVMFFYANQQKREQSPLLGAGELRQTDPDRGQFHSFREAEMENHTTDKQGQWKTQEKRSRAFKSGLTLGFRPHGEVLPLCDRCITIGD